MKKIFLALAFLGALCVLAVNPAFSASNEIRRATAADTGSLGQAAWNNKIAVTDGSVKTIGCAVGYPGANQYTPPGGAYIGVNIYTFEELAPAGNVNPPGGDVTPQNYVPILLGSVGCAPGGFVYPLTASYTFIGIAHPSISGLGSAVGVTYIVK